MKKQTAFLIIFIFSQCYLFGQSKEDSEIKKLDQLEIEAIHKGDTTILLKLWDKNYVVNNPYGVIVTIPEILGFIRAGQIDYSTVERVIEKITFNQNVAITMGKEIVTPQNATSNAGKIITMRYTHIWMKTKGVWHLIARQATIFPVN